MDFAALTSELSTAEDGTTPDPYPTLAWLREQAPVNPVPRSDGVGSIWFVTTHEHARQCLTDPRLSFDPANASVPQSAPGHTPYVLARDAPEHTRLRKLVGDAFAPRAVSLLAESIRRRCARLIEAFPTGSPVDLVTAYALPLPEMVSYDLLGIPESEWMPLGRGTELAIRIAFQEQFAGGPATDELHDYIARVVEFKRGSRGDDLTSSLLDKSAAGELRDDAELHGMLYLLFATGQLSTAPFIAGALARLLARPDLVRAALAGRIKWRSATEEVLRLDSPVQTTMPRFALEDFELAGHRIAKGDTVMVSVAAANRDPAHFDDADDYRPDRRSRGHLAFGQGPHFCIGAPLARMEGEIAVEVLFTTFPEIRSVLPPQDVRWTLGPMLRCPGELPVAGLVPDHAPAGT